MKQYFHKCAYTTLLESAGQHFHNMYEIIYVSAGEAVFDFPHTSYIADEGKLFFISKLEEHCYTISAGKYERYYIQITPIELHRMISDVNLRSVFIHRPKNFVHCFDMAGEKDLMKSIFTDIVSEFHSPGDASFAYSRSLFTQMLVTCFRKHKDQFPVFKQSINSGVISAQEFIDTNYYEQVSVESLAKKAFLSISYFSHEFKNFTGYSPMQYLVLSRISAAKELIHHTQLQVKDIALQSGFEDASNFIRTFKIHTGVTPGEYRKVRA